MHDVWCELGCFLMMGLNWPPESDLWQIIRSANTIRHNTLELVDLIWNRSDSGQIQAASLNPALGCVRTMVLKVGSEDP